MTEDMNQAEVNNYSVGDKVRATVVKVEEKQVQVEIPDSKKDGIIPISELSSLHVEKASDVVKEGDELELLVTKEEDDLYVLSKRKADAETAWDDMQKRFEEGAIFEAEIKEVVKGGLVVDLGIRGFIPASLVEDHFVEDFEDYKGRVMKLKIVELEQDKNRLILSHRAVLDIEKAENKQKVLENIQAGNVIDGKVQRLTDFGAFVDIGGVDGLVHISQLSHEHVEKPSDVLTEGQEVKVKVLSIDRDSERISLSIKETLPGPWENIADRAPIGSEHEGTVKRLVSYGAFVEVFPGVEGLVHISQISNRHIGTPHEVLEEGQTVRVKVLDANEQEHRLSLSMKSFEEAEPEETVDSYELPEESSGFQIGDILGDQLKDLK
ncbi:30S ribosomal protein S1 [Domibacillus sp. DTU_2020_1001157_1_SI_ALB_TIR_016]|uniref:30S ribosomal protein S1 n=1 Tax=Domibacillus sp. DTU_2020_1001157_1_SI_ALB_TIR_016 TaxID=3077789 RepID=UPI0028F002E1|nr:30S ribosomal protein S1 [Domibacillus sp. DTU_2020_1001157_1_SI_ALB_TIR_016]WNS82071.1 30S ribosomal protein S1 [Domibacillus sp. DTU_2020_1001157_1_SI_ALB_TIR_016]